MCSDRRKEYGEMTIFASDFDAPVTALIDDISDGGGLLLAATDSGLYQIYQDGQHEMMHDWEDGRRYVHVCSSWNDLCSFCFIMTK